MLVDWITKVAVALTVVFLLLTTSAFSQDSHVQPNDLMGVKPMQVSQPSPWPAQNGIQEKQQDHSVTEATQAPYSPKSVVAPELPVWQYDAVLEYYRLVDRQLVQPTQKPRCVSQTEFEIELTGLTSDEVSRDPLTPGFAARCNNFITVNGDEGPWGTIIREYIEGLEESKRDRFLGDDITDIQSFCP